MSEVIKEKITKPLQNGFINECTKIRSSTVTKFLVICRKTNVLNSDRNIRHTQKRELYRKIFEIQLVDILSSLSYGFYQLIVFFGLKNGP